MYTTETHDSKKSSRLKFGNLNIQSDIYQMFCLQFQLVTSNRANRANSKVEKIALPLDPPNSTWTIWVDAQPLLTTEICCHHFLFLPLNIFIGIRPKEG